jgi:hypothetical protein
MRDTSEIFGLEFKGKLRRFGICSVSETIGIDWSIFNALNTDLPSGQTTKNKPDGRCGKSFQRALKSSSRMKA